MSDALTPETAAKAAVYLATLLYLGGVTTAALAAGRPGPLPALATRVARLAACAGVLGLMLRLLLHASAVAEGAPDAETLRVVAFESRWGGRWQWQLSAAVAALAVALTRGLPRGTWLPAALAAAAWCVATPLLGHGAGSAWQHTTHAAHVAATGAWLGTVGILGLASRRASAEALGALGAAIDRFSPVALTGAAMAGASGAILAATYLGSVDAALSTPYGRWLLVKLAGVGTAGACGFVNWRRSRSRQAPAPRMLQAEALAALLTAVVTAVLTETEHPAP